MMGVDFPWKLAQCGMGDFMAFNENDFVIAEGIEKCFKGY